MEIQSKSADTRLFETNNIWAIILKIAPPVMLAQLIQALYNIVDSYFVGKYSADGLTALSIIYPIQWTITAIAVGTGVGVNTVMSKYYAQNKTSRANESAGTGMALALLSWLLFAALSAVFIKPYAMASAESQTAAQYAVTYGTIVSIGSIGIFLESSWTKIHQAGGNMLLPMIAQIAGAVTNIILDPVLILGCGLVPQLGIAGAAYATLLGQAVAALITSSACRKLPSLAKMIQYAKKIYRLGYPSILMQMLYTVYIVALNMILAGFSDEAITVLGLYYKMQSFFFIPLAGLQTCIVPLLSYTYARENYQRCKNIMIDSVILSMTFMLIGVACFELIPTQLLALFSTNADVLSIGGPAFRIIGTSFLPAVLSLMIPVFFQAIGAAKRSALLSIIRQIFCLIPIFWLLSRIDLRYAWFAFPISELIAGSLGIILYHGQLQKWSVTSGKTPHVGN